MSTSGDVRDILLRISRDMVGASTLDQLLQTMVDAAVLIVPAADRCVIHLLDDKQNRLIARVCSPPANFIAHGGIPAGVGISGRALRERETVAVDDTLQSSDFVPLKSGSDLRSLLVAPLYVAEISLGTLSLSSMQPHAFTEADRQNMRTLAAQASVSIRQHNLLVEAMTERERSDAIIEHIADGLVILDGEGHILRVNSALRRMISLSTDEFASPGSPQDLATCPERLRTLIEQGRHKNASPTEVEITLAPEIVSVLRVIPSRIPEPGTGEVLIVQDITPEREAAQAKALFISQVSHELRTPLQHILGFTSLISDINDLPREDYQRFFRHIQDEVDHLNRLVDDLGVLSRLETGRFSIIAEEMLLGDLIADIVEKTTPRATLREIALDYAPADHSLFVVVDPLRLQQVLGNLLENALKFVPSGGKVHVSVEEQDSRAIVHVEDNGPGISEEAQAHLFDRFYQVKAQFQRRNMGMGLGLYICREIIRALGGDIWVESQVGVGTKFSFWLPLSPA